MGEEDGSVPGEQGMPWDFSILFHFQQCVCLNWNPK